MGHKFIFIPSFLFFVKGHISSSIWKNKPVNKFVPIWVSLLALTGTATAATKSGIVTALGLSTPVTVECSPNRTYTSHVRPDRGDDKLDRILQPIVAELKSKRLETPLTLIYGNLETISGCFLYFPMKWAKTNTTLQQSLQQRTDFLPCIMPNIPSMREGE